MGKLQIRVATLVASALVLTCAAGGPASAASDYSVELRRSPSLTAPYGKKAVLKPLVRRSGNVKVTAKKLTVKYRGKTIARDRKSVNLGAGTYSVKTKIEYRTYRTVKTQRDVIKTVLSVDTASSTPVNCTVTNLRDAGGITFDAICTGGGYDGERVLRNLWLAVPSSRVSIAANGDLLEFADSPAAGSVLAATLFPADDLYKTKVVRETSSRKVWSATKIKTRTQTVVVKAGKRPSRTSPTWSGECPRWAPVKGNHGDDDWIYHVPGSTYYSRTIAEECFVSAAAAQRAGYRAPLR